MWDVRAQLEDLQSTRLTGRLTSTSFSLPPIFAIFRAATSLRLTEEVHLSPG